MRLAQSNFFFFSNEQLFCFPSLLMLWSLYCNNMYPDQTATIVTLSSMKKISLKCIRMYVAD